MDLLVKSEVYSKERVHGLVVAALAYYLSVPGARKRWENTETANGSVPPLTPKEASEVLDAMTAKIVTPSETPFIIFETRDGNLIGARVSEHHTMYLVDWDGMKLGTFPVSDAKELLPLLERCIIYHDRPAVRETKAALEKYIAENADALQVPEPDEDPDAWRDDPMFRALAAVRPPGDEDKTDELILPLEYPPTDERPARPPRSVV